MENTETINIASKLSIGTLGLDIETLKRLSKEGKGKDVDVAKVFALVNEVKEQPDKFDSTKKTTKFVGTFEGINVISGEVVRSGVMYLPDAATEYLKGFAASEGAAVAFAITVTEDKRPNSSTGYKFGVKAVVEKTGHDPFAALRPALAAPTKSK